MPKKSIMKKLKEREGARTAAVVQVQTAKSTNDQPLPLP